MAEALKAMVGRHVTLELVDIHGGVERLELDIVPDKQADFKLGLLGEGTPLARAILGATAGSDISYPVDDIVKVRLLAVERASERARLDVAARREAALRQAEAEVQRRNAVNFASSFSGKWGDYDPEAVEKPNPAKPEE